MLEPGPCRAAPLPRLLLLIFKQRGALMPDNTISLGWMLSGIAIFLFLLAIYSRLEGNRLSAARFVFHDIRRDMGRFPIHRVWWRAFSIAMGWRRRRHSHGTHRANVTSIRAAGRR